MYYSTTYPLPIGLVTLACSSAACNSGSLVGLWIAGQKYFGHSVPEAMTEKDNMPVFDKTKKWLDSYFAGKKPAITALPLAPIGSAFRQEVWNILCAIPYGEVSTYGDIAKQIAAHRNLQSMSSQAIGGAVGHNPISIIIPCHRVIGSNGSLTGYAGGLAVKKKLLALEGIALGGLAPEGR